MPVAEYILALDYGTKRVGVAIAHKLARLPRPLTTLPNDADLAAAVAELVKRESAYLVVVGLPRGMDGGYTEQTRATEAFATALAGALEVPVELADETLTSVDAEQTLRGKQYSKAQVDALAATYILERYLAEQAPAKEQTHEI